MGAFMKNQILEFLNELHKNQEKYLILAAVDDNATSGTDMEILQALNDVGFSLKRAPGKSYIAVLNGRQIIYEKFEDMVLIYTGTVDGVRIKITSAGYESGKFFSNIWVEGEKLGISRKRGLTIALINRKTGKLSDWIKMDIFLGKNEIIQRKESVK